MGGEQVAEFPEYRSDLIKLARDKAQMRKVAAGNASRVNAAEAEEDAKSGFTDESLKEEDTTKPHDKYVLSPAGARLGFYEVEDIIADMKKAGEKVDINHALIRGLRRGFAIYTNEVGFSCYRRQVQMLAQKGRLAVVFSDEALAYGVNMPFRSCVFCGDMGDSLTSLVAQQMQGRAGPEVWMSKETSFTSEWNGLTLRILCLDKSPTLLVRSLAIQPWLFSKPLLHPVILMTRNTLCMMRTSLSLPLQSERCNVRRIATQLSRSRLWSGWLVQAWKTSAMVKKRLNILLFRIESSKAFDMWMKMDAWKWITMWFPWSVK